MKTKNISLILLITLVMSACNAGTATQSEDASLEGFHTSVAMTLSAQPATVTSTPRPTSTSTMLPLVTLTGRPTSTSFVNTTSSSSASTSCDNSSYLSDVTIPDGTVLEPGEEFTKTWSLQNIGTCQWTTSYSIAYYSGSSLSGSATALSDSVDPGESISVSVDMLAPSITGSYTGYWRLQNAAGTSFGEIVYVQIVVASSDSTATLTPTATDEADSDTSTPTTAVSTPTTAPTPTSAPAATPESAVIETLSSQ